MASQETRSDANKALYYKIYSDIHEKEKAGTLAKDEQEIMDQAKQIIEKTVALEKLNKAKSKIDIASEKSQQNHERAQLLTTSAHTKFSLKEMNAMMLRSKLKDKIFEEKLQTHVELVRRKLDFELIKDNHENRVTQ